VVDMAVEGYQLQQQMKAEAAEAELQQLDNEYFTIPAMFEEDPYQIFKQVRAFRGLYL
jgi:hypothetical protein